MVDSSILHLVLASLLECQLFVEGEDSTLRGLVDVASSSSAAAEVGAALGQAVGEKRSWATSGAAIRGLGDLEGVTGASSSGVGVLRDVWVRLDDLEVGWHFGRKIGSR